jgi:hypothetical protein
METEYPDCFNGLGKCPSARRAFSVPPRQGQARLADFPANARGINWIIKARFLKL